MVAPEQRNAAKESRHAVEGETWERGKRKDDEPERGAPLYMRPRLVFVGLGGAVGVSSMFTL